MKKSTSDNRVAGSVPAKDVDAYLAALPAGVRTALEDLRKAIRAAAPQAEEVISYRIPTYKYHGPLVHFLAHPQHCSFVTASRAVVEKFKSELEGHEVSGTTIHFTAENPLPAALVGEIVKARMAENELHAKKK